MMDTYSIFTKKNWLETRREISEEMRKWGISDWIAEQKGSTEALKSLDSELEISPNDGKKFA